MNLNGQRKFIPWDTSHRPTLTINKKKFDRVQNTQLTQQNTVKESDQIDSKYALVAAFNLLFFSNKPNHINE